MFRYMTELKGLIVDIDSLDEDLSQWNKLLQMYQCFFLTTNETRKIELEKVFGSEKVILVPRFIRMFSPSQAIHEKALMQLQLLTSEVAYVSSDEMFITNALCFLSGTILIKAGLITYEIAGQCPDLICQSLSELAEALKRNNSGFFGEVVIAPEIKTKRGYSLLISFYCDEVKYPLYALGRYFGYSHYMSQLHPYSSSIFLNKRETGKAYGIFDFQFRELYSKMAKHISNTLELHCICNVPVRPGKKQRFLKIIEAVSCAQGLENISQHFSCVKDYETQKGLTMQDRQENIKGVFAYNGTLYGKTVLLLDDIITTGATVQECIRALKAAGAVNVVILALAVNQMGGTYWSGNQPIVQCPDCDKKMCLLVNTKTRDFFYSCNECGKSFSYMMGRKQVIDRINEEF